MVSQKVIKEQLNRIAIILVFMFRFILVWNSKSPEIAGYGFANPGRHLTGLTLKIKAANRINQFAAFNCPVDLKFIFC